MKQEAPVIYVWFAENKGAERDGEQFIRAWTHDPARVDGLRNAIGKEPTLYSAILQAATDKMTSPTPSPISDQAAGEPVAWRITDGEGGYEYQDDEPNIIAIQWAARYGRKYEALYLAGPCAPRLAFDKAHADCTDCDGTTCTMNCSGKENV